MKNLEELVEKNGIYLSITDRRMKLLKIGIKKYTEKHGMNEIIIKYKSSYDESEKEFTYDFGISFHRIGEEAYA